MSGAEEAGKKTGEAQTPPRLSFGAGRMLQPWRNALPLLTLRRKGTERWEQRVTSTRLWPQTQRELTPALEEAGFGEIIWWGDMQSAPFDPASSPNLVVTARRLGWEQTSSS